jgi:hypothetical protein
VRAHFHEGVAFRGFGSTLAFVGGPVRIATPWRAGWSCTAALLLRSIAPASNAFGCAWRMSFPRKGFSTRVHFSPDGRIRRADCMAGVVRLVPVWFARRWTCPGSSVGGRVIQGLSDAGHRSGAVAFGSSRTVR